MDMVNRIRTIIASKTYDSSDVVANEHMPIILGPGVIQTVFSGAAPATGATTLFVEYEPLVPGAKIV